MRPTTGITLSTDTMMPTTSAPTSQVRKVAKYPGAAASLRLYDIASPTLMRRSTTSGSA